jgi:hypothetical protein
MSKTKALLGHSRGLLTSLFLVSTACTGVSSLPNGPKGTAGPGVTDPGNTTNPDQPANGSGGGSPGPTNTPGVGAAGASTTPQPGGLWTAPASASLDSGRATLRRLNNPEYDNTMRDLLGTMTQASVVNNFPEDGTNENFDTNGQTLAYTALLFTGVQTATEALIAELVARPAADPVRMRLLPCAPTVATMQMCLTTILTPFMTKAYRRPVTAAEVTAVATLGTTIATAHNDPAPGLAGALEAVLLSPSFLFRIESSTDIASTTPTKLNDYELATRLSYFLGSTMPDAALTTAAAAGQLTASTDMYNAQVDRLLMDATRAQALVRTFTLHWLGISDTTMVAPDVATFPTQFDDNLRLSAPQETTQFFASLIADKQPLSTLVTANYTFVNDRLAQFYGITSPGGTTFVKEDLPASSNRMGILTQETFLTITSLPARTSPVKRGVWVLENLLCDGTPAPPPGVPMFPAAITGTVRAQLKAHRVQASCGACHNLIDPIGLAFENFDAIGEYRTKDNGIDVDPSAQMADGTAIAGPSDLISYVAKDPRLNWCLTKQAMTYGVGRSFEASDGRAYIKGVAGTLGTAPTWPALFKAVANSQAFLTGRGEAS